MAIDNNKSFKLSKTMCKTKSLEADIQVLAVASSGHLSIYFIWCLCYSATSKYQNYHDHLRVYQFVSREPHFWFIPEF